MYLHCNPDPHPLRSTPILWSVAYLPFFTPTLPLLPSPPSLPPPPPLLLSLVFVKSTELGLQMMQLCGRALQRLLYGLFGGTEPSRDVLDLVKSSSFTLRRAAAQEQLARQRSFTR